MIAHGASLQEPFDLFRFWLLGADPAPQYYPAGGQSPSFSSPPQGSRGLEKMRSSISPVQSPE